MSSDRAPRRGRTATAAPRAASSQQGVAIIGGCGHVGLPLGLALAERGWPIIAVDRDEAKVRLVQSGRMPFLEAGAEAALARVLGRTFSATTDQSAIRSCGYVIVCIGTPVDRYLSPDVQAVLACVDALAADLRDGHVLVLRSTLAPGTSQRIVERLGARRRIGVAYCPERIAQGASITELATIPQVVSATDDATRAAARALFGTLAPEVIDLSLEEAELLKLFSNAWRYITFAAANAFFMMARARNLDYYRIREALQRQYPRAAGLPPAGLAAGPCLRKDTLQLAAASQQAFGLGYAAMLVNEQLPDFLVEEARQYGSLAGKRVGLLGMAFKPDNDDARESLAYKLKRLLLQEGATVLCTDPYVRDPDLHPLEEVLTSAELLVVSCPHTSYRLLELAERDVIDCWGLLASRAAVPARRDERPRTARRSAARRAHATADLQG